MTQPNTNKLNLAFLMILRPIARLFLCFGRGFQEFSELSKIAFVSVASEDHGLGGRPTNASRIAAMTGLTRKEIRRVRSVINGDDSASAKCATPLQEVVSGWNADEEFQDSDGKPAVLPLLGEKQSFRRLIKRFAGDIPEGAMRKELERTGQAELKDDHIRLLPPNPAAAITEDTMASQLRAGPFPLLAALAHNEMNGVDERGWPTETVTSSSIRSSDVNRVRRLVSQRLSSATKHISDLLDAYDVLNSDEGMDEPTVPISVGVFYAEHLNGSKR